MSWTSFHAFVHAGLQATDSFLLEGVAPLIEHLVEHERIQSWFFIRYWEGGPHIRLRLRDCSPGTEALVLERLTDHLRKAPRAAAPLDPLAHYRSHGGEGGALERYGWRHEHEIVAIPYEPETARYGGPAGLAISEDLFCEASQIALALIRLTPTRARRVPAAVQLLFSMIQAIGFTERDAVAWQRSNTAAWSHYVGMPLSQIGEAAMAAQGDYFANERAWLDLRKPGPAEDRPSLAKLWARRLDHAMTRFREARDAGSLDAPIEGVMWSQLHMLHNRIGLSIADECVIASLAAVTLARGRARPGFAADTSEALDRQYHEHSKYVPHLLDEQRPQDVPAPDQIADPVPPWNRTEPGAPPRADRVERVVSLARAGRAAPLGSLAEALLQRRSCYDGYGAMTQGDLAALLELAVGPSGFPKRRTYPSGGARYPVQSYVLVRDVDGIASGLYLYDAGAHALRWISAPPLPDALARCSPHLWNGGSTPAPLTRAVEAPVWIFPVADLSYQRRRYGLRSYRLVLLECGHLTQNLCLVATALGLSCITIGAFFDDALNQLLSLDGVNRSALYMIPLGRPTS